MRNILLLLLFPLALAAFEASPVTPYPVLGYRQITFFDHDFKTSRDLLIWYPVPAKASGSPSINPWDTFYVDKDAAPEKFSYKLPVIYLSHGYQGTPHELSWLIRGLVENNFIVIALTHMDRINDKLHINHWLRALDVRKALDIFSKNPMASYANLDEIGFAGFSLGGTTGIWVAGGISDKLDKLAPTPEFSTSQDFAQANTLLPTLNKEMMAKDWREPRIKAVFLMAPAWAWIFNQNSLKNIQVPAYIIAPALDDVLVTKNNAGLFARLIPHAVYQEIPGRLTHFIFISALTEAERRKADPADAYPYLFKDSPNIDRRWVQQQVVDEAANFFNSVFPDK